MFVVSIVLLVWKGSIEGTKNYVLDLIYFEPGWGKLEITYFIPLLFGLVNTLFAVLGFVKGYKTEFRFFTTFSFISLSITAFFNLFGFTLFVPYSRAVHYTMLALIPLTATGFYAFLKYLNNFLNLKQKINLKSIFSLIMTLFFMLIILSSKYDLDLKYKYYQNLVMTESDYETLLWIKENLGENNVFITPYFMTSAVYPITNNQVISIIPAQLEGGLREDNLNFYNYDCEKQKGIISESGAHYILSHNKLDCDFLEEIYPTQVRIYKIKL